MWTGIAAKWRFTGRAHASNLSHCLQMLARWWRRIWVADHRRRPDAGRCSFALPLRSARSLLALSPLVVRRAARRAGLPAVGSHRLRHFAARATLRGGAPLPEVAELLRQRDLEVTARYAIVDPPALRELARPWPGGLR